MSRVNEKVIITPIANPESALGNPWQEGEHDAHFEAQEDVEQYRYLRRHMALSDNFRLQTTSKNMLFLVSCHLPPVIYLTAF